MPFEWRFQRFKANSVPRIVIGENVYLILRVGGVRKSEKDRVGTVDDLLVNKVSPQLSRTPRGAWFGSRGSVISGAPRSLGSWVVLALYWPLPKALCRFESGTVPPMRNQRSAIYRLQ